MVVPLPRCHFMILITTALMIEARPLIDRLGLKAHGNETFRVFYDEKYLLAVSGTGALRSSAATAWAMGRFEGIHAAVNIGFCGAAEEVAGLHEWYFINSIRDAATGRLSMPDILIRPGMPEAGLLTSPVVVKGRIEEKRLVDMEGSGFFEAARQFLAPDCIALLKWVSDPLTGEIEIEPTVAAYAQSLEKVMVFLENWGPLGESHDADGLDGLVSAINSRLRLSETQQLALRDWLFGYLARGGEAGRILEMLPEQCPAAKQGNNRVFERLKDALKG
jgi:nucleoside phosphorylase